jgi:hypothetical protein
MNEDVKFARRSVIAREKAESLNVEPLLSLGVQRLFVCVFAFFLF